MIVRPSALPLVIASLLALGGVSVPVLAGPPTPTYKSEQLPPIVPAQPGDGAASAPDDGRAPGSRVKDAKIEHLITEDSQVRIEEIRVRGVTRKIIVHSKLAGVPDYEIQPRDPGVDPEQDHAAGMRLFNFGF